MASNQVIIPTIINPPPSSQEVSAAQILSKHYKTIVEFLVPRDSYKQKTPDIVMGGRMWEIKSPVGNSSRTTIKKQIQNAIKQSENIIIDGRKTKISDKIILSKLQLEAKNYKKVSKIIFISKTSDIVEVFSRR